MTTAILNKVLIVDDDRAILRILTAHLEDAGYEVYEASNGRHAFEIVQQEQPSYVITDWEMPELGGLELCRHIRRLDLPHDTYILFLTARTNEDALVDAMDAGADDFLNKPLRKNELLARLTAAARVLQLESHLSQLAAHDALSGLLLRRPFAECAEKEWHRSLRNRLPLSIVMIDIDYFKQVNDTHGHPVGDAVIRSVADPVTDADGNLLGIVAVKDVLAIARDPLAQDKQVNEVMRTNVITYKDDAPFARILSFLTRASMRSVVITSAGKPCGLISRAGILRWFLDNRWKIESSENPDLQRDANDDATAEDESALLNLAGHLADEADRLHHYLQCPHPEHDAAPIVGGASRMQQLIEDLLAGSASGNRTGGGLPF